MTDPTTNRAGNDAPLAEWPRELDRGYEPLGLLGRGGLAVVFRARDRALGRQVAVKILRPRVAGDLDTIARVVRVAPALSQLQHSNIVALYAIERLVEGSTALIMQLVPGRTLKTELAAGALGPSRAERVLFDVARALSHAHTAGVFHGDVKPENIFVDEISGKAVLADFGIARVRAAPQGLTLHGSTIGTPRYMAPEQFEGVLNDPRSDLYSLGIVGWEMLSGQRAWAGESLSNVIHRQKLDLLPPLDTFREDVPPRLQYLVEGLMQKNPDQRWASALLFISVLASGNAPPGFHRWLDAQGLRRRQVSHLHPVPTPPENQRGILTPVRPRELDPADVSPTPSRPQRPSVVPGSPSVVAALKAPPAPAKAVVATRPPDVPAPVRTAEAADSTPSADAIEDETTAFPEASVERATDTATKENGARRMFRELSPGENLPLGLKLGILGAVAFGALIVTIGLPGRPRRPSATIADARVLADSGLPSVDSTSSPGRVEPRRGARGGEPNPISEKKTALASAAAEGAARPNRAATPRIEEATAAIDSLFRQLTREDSLILAADRLRNDSAILRRGRFEPDLNDGPPARDVPRSRQVAAAETPATAPITRPGATSANGLVATRESTPASRRAPARPLGPPVSFPNERSTIAAGMRHSCVLSPNGQALCWGSNQYGQLGDGSLDARDVPAAVARGLSFAQISAGSWHTCGLTRSGELLCWGRNEAGQLGDGTTVGRSTPARVTGFVSYRSVRSGAAHTCGISWDDAVRCWGSNAYGELGDGTRQPRTEPVVVRLPGPARAVTAGAHHSCALLSDGSAYCWGRNHAGQLGNGTALDDPLPVPVSGDTRFVSIAAGSAHTCAVAVNGRAWCWGENISGQLGAGTAIVVATRPLGLDGNARFSTIVSGQSHSCALGRDARIWCWGRNGAGQLGNGTTTNQPRPVASIGVSGFASLNSTGSHTCAAASGDVYCWGDNTEGQLGHGNRENATVPIRVRTPR